MYSITAYITEVRNTDGEGHVDKEKRAHNNLRNSKSNVKYIEKR